MHEFKAEVIVISVTMESLSGELSMRVHHYGIRHQSTAPSSYLSAPNGHS